MFRFLAFRCSLLLRAPSPPPSPRRAALPPTGHAGGRLHLRADRRHRHRLRARTSSSIPGLGSQPAVWNGTMAAVPGYRYHLIHVSGFAGRPAGANAAGPGPRPRRRRDRPLHPRGAARAGPRSSAIRWAAAWAILVAGRNPGLVSKVMVVDMMPSLGAMFRQPGITEEQLERDGRATARNAGRCDRRERRIQTSTIIAQMVRTESERPAVLAASLASDPAVSAQGMYDIIVSQPRRPTSPISACR